MKLSGSESLVAVVQSTTMSPTSVHASISICKTSGSFSFDPLHGNCTIYQLRILRNKVVEQVILIEVNSNILYLWNGAEAEIRGRECWRVPYKHSDVE
jgi:hypothetical protein